MRKSQLEHAQQLRSGGAFGYAKKQTLARKRLSIEEDDDMQLEAAPDQASQTSAMDELQMPLVQFKFFQFHDNYRPAYYGTWSKYSLNIRPRAPFGKETSLDYAVDSDDEWEEGCLEEEGMVESLSSGEDDDDDEDEEDERDRDRDDDDAYIDDSEDVMRAML